MVLLDTHGLETLGLPTLLTLCRDFEAIDMLDVLFFLVRLSWFESTNTQNVKGTSPTW